MIKITTIVFAVFWLSLGAQISFYITREYTELKYAAKPMQDRKDLAQLGFIDDVNEIAFVQGE